MSPRGGPGMRIGVLGSMVWDRIEHPDGPPVERWGGISYSLAAAAAALPPGWAIRPIIKLGRDLAARATAFLEGIPGLEPEDGLLLTDDPTNRVVLRYRDRHHRDEQLSGGVGPWTWAQLAPRLEGLDALYVNLISGFELALDTALRLRAAVPAPLYADLHSLVLGIGPGGHRVPVPLASRDEWLSAFDVVQVNEQELTLVAGDDDPDAVARAAVRNGLAALLVTKGPAGVRVVSAGREAQPWTRRVEVPHSFEVPAGATPASGDPTGCGDVWGATCFVALVRGEPLERAVRLANRAAASNVRHRGADGLHTFLTEGA